MPVFEVEANGKTFEVEAPDQDTALKAVSGVAPAPKPSTGDPGIVTDTLKGLGTGVVRGAAQLAGTGGDISKGADFLLKKLEGTTVPVQEARSEMLGAMPSWLRRFHETPTKTVGSAEIMGGIDRAVDAPVTSYDPKTLPGKFAKTIGEFAPGVALGGGVIRGAVAPGTTSELFGQLLERYAPEYEKVGRFTGAVLGGFVGPRTVTPVPSSPNRERLVRILEDEGVTSITAGQRTGSDTLRYMESAFGDAPLAGRKASRITDEGQRQFTEAVMRRAGAGPDATPEVLSANQRRLGDQFADLAGRNNLATDNRFIVALDDAVRGYQRVPPSQQRAIVEGYVNDIMPHINNGSMPGPVYQEMRSRLSRQAHSLRESDPTLSEALRNMRNALDDAMGRSISPADRELWQQTRREYGAQKTIEKSASKAGEATAEGQITPANLRATVSAQNRGAYARGEGDFSELARAGAGVMAPMPQSGTAPRSAIYHMLNFPTAGIAPAVTGRLLMSRPAQAYMGNQVLPLQSNVNPRQAALISALLASRQQTPELQK